MDDERMAKMFAQSQALRNRMPQFAVQPQLELSDNFATYGGDVRAEIPLGRNATLGLSGGATAGRGYGQAAGARMPPKGRAGLQFRYEF